MNSISCSQLHRNNAINGEVQVFEIVWPICIPFSVMESECKEGTDSISLKNGLKKLGVSEKLKT